MTPGNIAGLALRRKADVQIRLFIITGKLLIASLTCEYQFRNMVEKYFTAQQKPRRRLRYFRRHP